MHKDVPPSDVLVTSLEKPAALPWLEVILVAVPTVVSRPVVHDGEVLVVHNELQPIPG